MEWGWIQVEHNVQLYPPNAAALSREGVALLYVALFVDWS